MTIIYCNDLMYLGTHDWNSEWIDIKRTCLFLRYNQQQENKRHAMLLFSFMELKGTLLSSKYESYCKDIVSI